MAILSYRPSSLLARVFCILDTGMGPNFVRKCVLRRWMANNICNDPLFEIRIANYQPTKLLGILTLSVELATHNVRLDFLICGLLTAPFVLRDNFCDRIARAIRTVCKDLRQEDGTMISIVLHQ